MAAGRVFVGMREGPISFRPTYKFDKGSANPYAYDSSEKRRVPAWCDRVFFRGSTPFATPEVGGGARGRGGGGGGAGGVGVGVGGLHRLLLLLPPYLSGEAALE